MNLIQTDLKKKFYKAFGEIIQIDFEIPFLPPLHESLSSVSIRESKFLNKKLFSTLSRKKPLVLDHQKGIFSKQDIFCAEILDTGKNIEYSVLNKNLNNFDLGFKLLTHPISAALFQQNHFILHCSAIEINKKAFIFIAPSTHGKSYIASRFMGRGRLICEDIGKIIFKDQGAYIYPAIPCIKLNKKNNINKFDSFTIQGDARKRQGYIVDKFDFENKPVEIQNCYFLIEGRSEKITKVFGKDSFKRIFLNSVSPIPRNNCLISEQKLLDNVSLFTEKCKLFDYIRPMDYKIDKIENHIEKSL